MIRLNNATLDEAAIKALSKDHKDWVYNALDCCVTYEIKDVLTAEIDATSRATYEFSKSLQAPVLEMTLRGTKIDKHKLSTVLSEYNSEIKLIESNLLRIVKEGVGIEKFNWRSVADVKFLFYEVMGYKPVLKRNAQSRMVPTVDRKAIEKLSQYFFAEPICRHLLLLREHIKKVQFLNTKLDPDERIRTQINIAGTNTGRFASSMSEFGTGTNIQNVDRKLRSVFIPDDGMKFCNIDLEQADARNVGAICWNLFVDSHGSSFAGSYLNAVESGDLHTFVTRMVWPDLAWSDDPIHNRAVADQIFYRDMSYRDIAKRLGHGTNYQGTPRTMAAHAKVQISLIENFQQKYFGAFPVIKEWHKWVKRQLANEYQITTLLGRRRYFFGRPEEATTIREAVAYEPQSMTADFINQGMLRLWRLNKVQFLNQVHDSILFQFPVLEEETIIPLALATVQSTIILKQNRSFTMPGDAKVGWNWGDYNKKKPEENPNGLRGWKRGETIPYKPEPAPKRLSLREALCGN